MRFIVFINQNPSSERRNKMIQTTGNEVHLDDYARCQLHYLTEVHTEAKKVEPRLTRNELVERYVESPFSKLYEQYWNGEHHKPKVSEVAFALTTHRTIDAVVRVD